MLQSLSNLLPRYLFNRCGGRVGICRLELLQSFTVRGETVTLGQALQGLVGEELTP